MFLLIKFPVYIAAHKELITKHFGYTVDEKLRGEPCNFHQIKKVSHIQLGNCTQHSFSFA